MKLVWCVLALLALVSVSTGTNPGVKIRLTQKGLEYGRQLGITNLHQKLSTMTIPDMSGTEKLWVGKVQYSITGIRIVHLNIPSSSLGLVPGTGISISINNADIKAQGNWRVKYGWLLSASGSLELTVSGVTISVTIAVRSDSTSRPTLSMAQCTASVRDVDVRFSGSLSWLYNLFRSFLQNPILRALEPQICPLVARSIADINTQLGNLNVLAKVDQFVEIDYSMVGSPLISNASIDLNIKGVCYNIGQRTEPPFSATPFSLPSQNTNMLYIGLSAFTINSAALAYHNAGAFSLDVTNDLLSGIFANARMASSDSVMHLNTKTFEASIPEVARKYPDLMTKLLVNTVKEPVITFEPNNVTVQAWGSVTAYAIHSNSTLSPLFVLNLEASASAKVNITGLNLTASLALNRIHLSLQKSYVGKFELSSRGASQLLDNLLKTILELTVIPKINARLQKGFPLPAIRNVKLTNPQLVIMKDYLLIGTDGTFLG